jgi:Zn-dependent peptidase ImmA (M78 family)
MTFRSDKLLRRGFKKEAEAISREVRGEMQLRMIDPLEPLALATHLEIPTTALSTCTDSDVVRHFRGKARRRFSAVTVFLTETERVILYNDYNSAARQNSDIAHECSHALLLHAPRPAFSSGGCRGR